MMSSITVHCPSPHRIASIQRIETPSPNTKIKTRTLVPIALPLFRGLKLTKTRIFVSTFTLSPHRIASIQRIETLSSAER
mgnify:CR=1 FL=1